VLDPGTGTFEEFLERLRPFHGEIKGILTRGRVLSGIDNAYADELLFAAEVYPYRKRGPYPKRSCVGCASRPERWWRMP
jgi:formamidopyrimidine-DNA glycosylase